MRVRAFIVRCAILAALSAAASASAQDGPGLGAVRDTLDVQGREFQLRSPVVPGSEAIWLVRDSVSVELNTGDYLIDYMVGALVLRSHVEVDSLAKLAVHYRVIDLDINEVYARRRIAEEEPDTVGLMRVIEIPSEQRGDGQPIFGNSQLTRRGSITRGVIAGNNRDVSLESGLRMELSGPISDDLTVQAVLTDENTPIQPEGTTQQLSDFDRVYIELNAPIGRARLGDVDLSLGESEFAAFSRKIQGAALDARIPSTGLFAGGSVQAAGATTRGIFQSQDIEAIEGVQGPYRLLGRQGEQFIIVIAGSEHVYLDGVELTRGESNDYTIDYATGELTFTPQRLITAERRITIDFEYTTSRFTRTLMMGEGRAGFWPTEDGVARAQFGVAVLRESDAATFGSELGLSETDLDAIAAAGDGQVLVDGAVRINFDPESAFVQYVRADTLFNGVEYEIFKPATAEADSVYRVTFTRVPSGSGQYIRSGQALNGILYEWVGPTGGEYVPFRLLPKPALRSLVDVRGSISPIQNVELFGEWAGSTNDLNTLSDVGSGDDHGNAYLAGVRLQPTQINVGGSSMGQLSASVRRRQQGRTFVGFDRTRPVEFNRMWNLGRSGTSFGSDSLREITDEGQIRWDISPRSRLVIDGGRLQLGSDAFSADRGGFGFHLEEPLLAGGALPTIDYRLDLTSSNDGRTGQEGRFFRQQGSLLRQNLVGRLTPGFAFDHERREQNITPDSVALGSFAFMAIRPSLTWTSPKLTASTSLEFRQEEEPMSGRLSESATATTLEGDVSFRPSGSFSSEARVAYRSKQFTDDFQELGREDNESLAIRWTNRATPLNRAVEVNSIYEALTERTPLLQETYILVGSEIGEYVWVDGGGEPRAGEPDGVSQVDEFFPETTPLEGTYARTFVPSDELFPTIGVQAQLRVRLDPGRLIRDRADRSLVARVLRSISTQTVLDVRERSTERNISQIYLLNPSFLQQREPRITADGDTLAPATISGRFRFVQDVTLFPSEPKYGVRFSMNHLSSTSRLAAGTETRLVQSARVDADASVSRMLRLRLIGELERNQTDSETFASRTFDIRSTGLEPQATLIFGSPLSVTVGVAYSDKTNESASVDQATGASVLRIPIDARVSVGRKLSLTLRGERSDVSVEGGDNTGLTSFELTDGRGAGTSYLWGVIGQYTINSFLRASLFYDGRAPADAPVIHTVRMQLSAVF